MCLCTHLHSLLKSTRYIWDCGFGRWKAIAAIDRWMQILIYLFNRRWSCHHFTIHTVDTFHFGVLFNCRLYLELLLAIKIHFWPYSTVMWDVWVLYTHHTFSFFNTKAHTHFWQKKDQSRELPSHMLTVNFDFFADFQQAPLLVHPEPIASKGFLSYLFHSLPLSVTLTHSRPLWLTLQSLSIPSSDSISMTPDTQLIDSDSTRAARKWLKKNAPNRLFVNEYVLFACCVCVLFVVHCTLFCLCIPPSQTNSSICSVQWGA